MKTPSRPIDEARRLEALWRYDILDTLPESMLDDLAAVAGQICGAPISLISLIDEQRQWFKSRVGLSFTQTARDVSFCGHAINESGVFIVADAAQDPRFSDNPLVVGDPYIRFYAGAPLVTEEGHALGTLCVMDRVPRVLTPSQEEALRVLSRQVMAQLELRRQTRELVDSEARLFQVFRNCPVGVAIQRWSDRTFVDVNTEFTTLFGWTREDVIGHTTEEMHIVEPDALANIRSSLEGRQGVRDVELAVRTRGGELRQVLIGTTFVDLRQERYTVTTFVDITGRKRAERELQEREGQLRLYARHSPAAIAMLDREMKYLVVSRRWMDDYHLGDQSIVGRSHYEVFPEIPQRWIEVHRRCLAGATERSDEDPFPRADGRIDWIRWEIRPWHEADGSIGGIIIFSEDITERKQAMMALRESEMRLNEAQRIAHIGSWRYVPDGPLTLSDEMYELHKLPRDVPLSGEALLAAVHPDDQPGRDFQAAVASGSSEFRSEYRVCWPDGQVRHLLALSKINRDTEGRLVEVVGTVQDVTERTLAAEALRAAEERMRFALKNAGVGIWDMDYRAGVLKWTEILEAQYGLQPGTFRGTFDAFVECVHPDDRESLIETLGETLKSGAEFTVQNRSLWPDGTVRWLSGTGRVILGEDGEPVRGIGISLDVTERRTLEAQYQQAQKMEAIGRLAGGVAHDFNNLLTAILGYCELLHGSLERNDPRQADVREIQKAGMSAAGLSRRLLAFSRKEIIKLTRLDLNVVVADMQVMLARLIGDDVRVVLGLGPALWPVTADRGQVEQIVLNLAVNARDAMPTGGTMTIETANVELDEHYTSSLFSVTPGPYVALTVTDSGTGMTEEVKARLFEPFFTTKEVGKGTGLGLATVHGIVRASGGTVEVDSEIGRGTSFRVYWPRADATDLVVDARPSGGPQRESEETVLVVDDADGVRQLVKRFLERQGYIVLLAANADEAVRVFEDNASIDVLLTDVVMPGASGLELTKALLARRPSLKVIYMSGFAAEAHDGILAPGCAFLHKPFTAVALGRKIREMLDR